MSEYSAKPLNINASVSGGNVEEGPKLLAGLPSVMHSVLKFEQFSACMLPLLVPGR